MTNNLTIYYVMYAALLLSVTMMLVWAIGRGAKTLACETRLSQFLAAGLALISIGYLTLTLRTANYPQPVSQLWEMALMKLGFGIILLGIVFLFDLLVLAVWQHGVRMRSARASELR